MGDTSNSETISLLALCLSGLLCTARAESVPRTGQTASAALRISVVVMPVVETLPPAKQASGSIIYNLQTPPVSEEYEIHVLPPEVQNGKGQQPAILKTLIVVPR